MFPTTYGSRFGGRYEILNLTKDLGVPWWHFPESHWAQTIVQIRLTGSAIFGSLAARFSTNAERLMHESLTAMRFCFVRTTSCSVHEAEARHSRKRARLVVRGNQLNRLKHKEICPIMDHLIVEAAGANRSRMLALFFALIPLYDLCAFILGRYGLGHPQDSRC